MKLESENSKKRNKKQKNKVDEKIEEIQKLPDYKTATSLAPSPKLVIDLCQKEENIIDNKIISDSLKFSYQKQIQDPIYLNRISGQIDQPNSFNEPILPAHD